MTDSTAILLATKEPIHINGAFPAIPSARIHYLIGSIPQFEAGMKVFAFIDWLLPEMSGIELCRRLRNAHSTAASHITMVLETGEAEDKRRAIRAGADDYVPGPLNPTLLAERMELYLSHARKEPARAQLRHGGLTVDPLSHQARWQGQAIALAPNEFRLLTHFLAHPDRLFARHALIEQIGKDSDALDDRTVDVWIGRLRRSLARHGAPNPIRTVRSLGYVLDSQER
jgi:two-component system, OmpR family, phosphate regulon response regulator PhoB